MLLEDYLKPLDIGQVEAARQLGVSLKRLTRSCLASAASPRTRALRLARFLKTSPQLRMRLQGDLDLYQAMQQEAQRAS
jgi:addiction module HigA family antidote